MPLTVDFLLPRAIISAVRSRGPGLDVDNRRSRRKRALIREALWRGHTPVPPAIVPLYGRDLVES